MAEGGEKSHHIMRRNSSKLIPPDFSGLKVILLGNSSSLRNSVGNLLLKKTVFNKKHKIKDFQPYDGEMNDQSFSVVNTPDLQHISRAEFINKVKALTGPLVFLLVLQPEDFTEGHRNKLQSLLESFSESSLLLISTAQPGTPGFFERIKNGVPYTWKHYSHLFINATEEDPKLKEMKRKELFNKIGQILKENNEEVLKSGPSEKSCLNLVLCGRSGAEKSSVLKSMFGQLSENISSDQCERLQGEVCGRWVTVVQLPPLSDKPVETLMEDCHSCVSLCGSQGVQAFILVLPQGTFTDEDKSELRTIQDMFSPAVCPFTVFLFTVDSDLTASGVSDSIIANREVQELCERRYLIYNTRGQQQQVSELIEFVETQRRHSRSQSYTLKTMSQGKRMVTDQLKETEDVRDKKPVSGQGASDCLRIALIGKTGCGKSSSANTILGRTQFEAMSSPGSVTETCAKAETDVDGRRVVVVDTPGLFDSRYSNDKTIEEICKCVSLLAPGPHVFLMVIQVGRFTQDEQETIKLIKQGFGKESQKYTMILFTRGDDLDCCIEKYFKRDRSLHKLVSDCGNHFHVFNNKDKTNRSQVKELIEKIDDMVKKNGGDCFTNDMLQKAEASIRKEMERNLKELS